MTVPRDRKGTGGSAGWLLKLKNAENTEVNGEGRSKDENTDAIMENGGFLRGRSGLGGDVGSVRRAGAWTVH